MSELTQCNYCALQRIEKNAARRGRTVEVKPDGHGWTGAYVDGVELASFLTLPTRCVC